MSNSRLPPKPGETPTKVVLHGTDPGDPAAIQLYNELRGQITRFHSKARQSREISGQPQVTMQQALPGGGRMRYVYNGGQEQLHVTVHPTRGTTEEGEEPTREQVTTPVLAVDVLFDPEQFEIGSVHQVRQATIHHPAEPPRTVVTYEAYNYSYNLDQWNTNAGRNADDYSETTVTLTFPGPGGNMMESGFSSLGAANAALSAWIAYLSAQTYPQPAQTTATFRVAGYTARPWFGTPYYTAYYETIEFTSVGEEVTEVVPGKPAYDGGGQQPVRAAHIPQHAAGCRAAGHRQDELRGDLHQEI